MNSIFSTPLALVSQDHPALRAVASPVENIQENNGRFFIPTETLSLIRQMKILMKEEGGVGLAAPQVGISLRVVVVCDNQGAPHGYVNPIIVHEEGSVVSREGCLSLPNQVCHVQRAQKVVVRALDESGTLVERSCDLLEAVCFQHEIDHLEGVLISEKKLPS